MPGSAIPLPLLSAAPPAETPRAEVVALDHEGRGVARVDGKVMFIDGALPGELVEYRRARRKSNFDLAYVTRIVRASSARVAPRCPHYERCGGCSLQHFEPQAQVAAKQRVLEDNLARIGKVEPDLLLPAIHGPYWGYRQRARLSAHYVPGKGGALVGFRERREHRVVDMNSCQVLPAHISALIQPLRELISGLSLANRIPQVEVALGEDSEALALRVLDAPTDADLARLREFSAAHGVAIHLQPAGTDSMHPLDPATPPLLYRLPEFDLTFRFRPIDFTQVNFAVNRILVRRAMALLAPAPGERFADMFCGLGNFSLAIARSGASVVGVEGNAELVSCARDNAVANALEHRAQFLAANLFEDSTALLAQLGSLDGMLIDPPRDGAQTLVHQLTDGPKRIVYVSCNAATLARDAGVLVHQQGYSLQAAGVVNMFPHTSHVESIALFARDE